LLIGPNNRSAASFAADVTPLTLAGAAAPAYVRMRIGEVWKAAIDEPKWLDQLRQLQPIRFCQSCQTRPRPTRAT
jgi:hypothetical protein